METQPQEVYLSFVSGFKSKLNFFMITIPEISNHLVPLEETICNRFVPAITGGHICKTTEKRLLSLPIRFGGRAIPFFMNKPQ